MKQANEFRKLNDAMARMTKAQERPKTETRELITRLRWIAGAGIVNHRQDTADLLEAADRMKEMDERIAILSAEIQTLEKMPAHGTDAEPLYPDDEKRYSGLIEEE